MCEETLFFGVISIKNDPVSRAAAATGQSSRESGGAAVREPVALTATEYELLRVLALDAGRVLTYDTLLRRVWGPRNGTDANLVRIFVKTLRKKLGEDAANPTWIFNERGVGYRMAEPGAA